MGEVEPLAARTLWRPSRAAQTPIWAAVNTPNYPYKRNSSSQQQENAGGGPCGQVVIAFYFLKKKKKHETMLSNSIEDRIILGAFLWGIPSTPKGWLVAIWIIYCQTNQLVIEGQNSRIPSRALLCFASSLMPQHQSKCPSAFLNT